MLAFAPSIDFFNQQQIPGYLAMFVGVAAYAMRDDRTLKALIGVCMVLWSTQYLILGAYTSMAVAAIVASRQLLTVAFPRVAGQFRHSLSSGYLFAFSAVLVLTWEGPRSLLPWFAAANATIAFMHLSGIRMRAQLMLSTALWLINAALVGAIGLALASALSLAVTSWTMYRLLCGRSSGPMGQLSRPGRGVRLLRALRFDRFMGITGLSRFTQRGPFRRA